MKNLLHSRITTIALVALVTLLAIHVVTVNTENVRLDLTQDDLYSLSSGTEAILEKMRQEGVKPVEIELYFSETAGKTLPRFIKDFVTYERYLRALLREYEVASDGKVRVRFVDPVPDSDEAQDARDYGLDGRPINQHGDLFFFGLVLETQTGSRDVIEFLWPNQQETVEYEISKKLSNLIWPQSQRIGVLSGLEVLGSSANPYMAQILAAQGKNPGEAWIAMQLLQETYQVTKIEPDTDSISADEFDLVVVLHPKSLGTRARWALDEWIVRGGNALIFVDPYSIDDQPPQNPQNPLQAYQYEPSSNLGELFRAWGIERPEGEVAADFELAVRRQVSRLGGAERILVDLAIGPETREATLATEHPVLQGLQDLRFFTPGVLRPLDTVPEGVTLTPLVTTTAQGSTLEMSAGFPSGDALTYIDLGQPAKLADRFVPGSEPEVLAYLVQGRLPSAFPDGASLPAETPPPPGLPPGIELPEPEGGERVQKNPVADEERDEATVLVFADVDFLSDQLAFQQSIFGPAAVNDNHLILLNAVDYLFGSEELMQVRAKRAIARPFTLFDEIEAEADEQSLEREKQLRAEIATFEEELREKTSNAGNVALLQKQVQDEVELLNERIEESNRELREIRKEKRAALESEEARVRFAAMGLMPLVVLALGLTLWVRRRNRDLAVRSRA